MTSMIQAFDFNETPVRVSGTPEAPLFVAADVCRVLEIVNTTDALRSLDEDEKTTLANPEGRAGSGAQSFNMVTESGLYTLIFKSRKKAAKEFRKWVTSVVLPSIRKNGFYLPIAIDFEKYPVCQDFSDIFSWLRAQEIEPNEAARAARSLLMANSKHRRPIPHAPRYLENPQLKEFTRLIHSLPEEVREPIYSPAQLLEHCFRHQIFPDFKTPGSSEQSHLSALGRRMQVFSGQIVAGRVLSIRGNKNNRRYVFTRVEDLTPA